MDISSPNLCNSMTSLLLSWFWFGVAAATAGKADVTSAGVYENGPFLMLMSGERRPGAVAWGTFEDGLNTTGWGILDIEASKDFSDHFQHYGAGMVEGFLTARHIETAYRNAVWYSFQNNISKPAISFLQEQLSWSREQVRQNPADNFWKVVSAILSQLDGLMEGYRIAATYGFVANLEDSAFLILNAVGDLFQILPAVDPSRGPDFSSMTSVQLTEFVKTRGLCSALIKVPGAFDDLFMAHSSWWAYSDTDRIFKHYNFDFHADTGANRVSFSSYPGYLYSLDDFYMMDSGLGMVQTSNNLMNNTLLKLVTPKSLLAWQRVRAANYLARSGKEWHTSFSKSASGTYVNQYMVVDFKLFTPGHALLDNTLWVVEEIPGLVEGEDQTNQLRRGYWPSYNVPYYPEVYRLSGYTDPRLGPDATYELAPRAKIFRRDQGSVIDMESLKRIMRYANYSDPYALKPDGSFDEAAAICMRGDLGVQGTGPAMGCYDTKVTSHLHGFWKRRAEIVNGPSSTVSDGTQGRSGNLPFKWRSQDVNITHIGLPEVYNFDFVTTEPKDLSCTTCSVQETVVI